MHLINNILLWVLLRLIVVVTWLITLPCGGIRLRGNRTVLNNLPPERGIIVAFNHTSMLDPMLSHYVLSRLGRQGAYMAKEQLFKQRLIGGFLRFLGAFPVDRGSNPRSHKMALDRALEELASGKAVVLYPEGTRQGDGTIAEISSGVFHLAKRGYPVLCIGIRGARQAFRCKDWRHLRGISLQIDCCLLEVATANGVSSREAQAAFLGEIQVRLASLSESPLSEAKSHLKSTGP